MEHGNKRHQIKEIAHKASKCNSTQRIQMGTGFLKYDPRIQPAGDDYELNPNRFSDSEAMRNRWLNIHLLKSMDSSVDR